MQVVYLKSLSEKVHEALAEASAKNRRIDYIALDRGEAEEAYKDNILLSQVPAFLKPSFEEFKRVLRKGSMTYYGIRLRLQEGV